MGFHQWQNFLNLVLQCPFILCYLHEIFLLELSLFYQLVVSLCEFFYLSIFIIRFFFLCGQKYLIILLLLFDLITYLILFHLLEPLFYFIKLKL